METKKKWITIKDYVDIETGEIISKSQMEREYYETGKKSKTIQENEKYRITRIASECRKNRQTKLFN